MNRKRWMDWITLVGLVIVAGGSTSTVAAGAEPLSGRPTSGLSVVEPGGMPGKDFNLSSKNRLAEKSSGQESLPLDQLVSDGTLKFELTSDGVRTTRCQIKLVNNTNKDVTVFVPQFQTYISPDRRFQDTMSTEEKTITVPAAGTESFQIRSMSISTKLQRSPPTTAIAYKPGPYRNPTFYNAFCLIVERAKALIETGQFEKMSLPKSWNDQTIAQLAIWKFTGSQTGNKTDDINAKNVAKDMMSAMGMSHNTFNAEQRKSLDERVQSILAAVDLTLKGIEGQLDEPQ